MLAILLQKAGNQYKRTPYKILLKYCKFFDDEKYFVQDVRKLSNFPPKETCPWPKGKYTIDGYEVRFQHFYLI